MLLQKAKIQHINTISHESKVVVFGTDSDGKIWYTVKQDGFEDSYLNVPAEQRTGWENWQELIFPDETDDKSVIDKEAEELTVKATPSQFIIKSRYKTKNQSAVAPVQLISALGHVYVFRQSKSNTLLVDRFVLDGLTNKLTRKLEVRFKRSRQKYEPSESMNKNGNALQNVDSLDFRDLDGNFFYEPTTELCLVNNLQNGWFTVVLVPTKENDRHRWHIFAYNSSNQKVELTTILASEEGLFDVKDYTLLEPKSEDDETLIPRSIPGIIKRTFDLTVAKITDGLSATKYDLQTEKKIPGGEVQLIKKTSRLMLAVPTDKGTAAISFAIASDGTLSEINETPTSTVLRSNEREILLPLNTLDEIKSIAGVMPPQGKIMGIERGSDDPVEEAEDKIRIISDTQVDLENGDEVKIQGTLSYNGVYRVSQIDANSFVINNKWSSSELGFWEKQEEDKNLIFDGQISSYQITADGQLQIKAFNHGLENGDEVQIIGSQSLNDAYPVIKINSHSFALKRLWGTAEAVNIKLQSRKRRGIIFDGKDDFVATEDPFANNTEFTIALWVKPTAINDGLFHGFIGKQGDKYRKPGLWISDSNGGLHYDSYSVEGSRYAGILNNFFNVANQWIHVAWVKQGTEYKFYRNGELFATQPAPQEFYTKESSEYYIGKVDNFWHGEIAEVRIWKQASTPKEIKNTMYLQLTGKEAGLVGYWRLGAIAEGKERKTADFSVSSNDGIVNGGAYIGGITLPRTLSSQTSITLKGLVFDGVDNLVELPPASFPTGNEITISFWAKGGTSLPQYTAAIAAVNATNQRIYSVSLPWIDQVVYYDCGGGANGYDRIEKAASASQYKGTWTHWAFTKNAATGEMKIYCNGVLWHSGTGKIKPLSPAGKFIIGMLAGENRAYYDGTIAELSVWNKSLIPEEITSIMYQQLTGKEAGLVGYWQLNEIVGNQVKDLSPNGYHGTVQGGVTVSPNTVTFNSPSNSSRFVVKYSNSELFAVTQQETYEESFEFKINSSTAIDINNVDSLGNKIFLMSYWGKTSRSAEEKIEFSAVQNQFENLGDGWYRASCRFTVPESISMLRCFEIAQVRGTWNSLEIRKHRIRLVSDAITEAKYNDTVTLTSIVDRYAALEKDSKIFASKEREESRQLREKLRLEKELAQLASIPKLQQRLNELKWFGFRLVFEEASLRNIYQSEKNNPLNYWCRLKNGLNPENGYGSDCYLYRDHPTNVIVATNNNNWRLFWKLEKTAMVAYPSKIDDAEAAWSQKLAELQRTQQQIAGLEAFLQMGVSRKAELEAQLANVNNQLNQLRNELNQLNTNLLAAIKNIQLTPQSMPVVHKVTKGSQAGLETTGGMLEFVRTGSRISAIETCEGNVQLSYFDTQGRMRLTNYDATSDSRNIAFEQWMPEPLRTCLNFNNTNSLVELNAPILINQEWTVEAWFCYPFNDNITWRVLVSDGNGVENQIVVYNQVQLGTRINGFFHDSGYSLENLSSGWHHLIAMGEGTGDKTTTTFYIDGQKVGEPIVTKPSISLNGQKEHLVLAPESIPVGNEITVSFWAKGDTSLPKETSIIEAVDGKNKRILNIHLPWSDGRIQFDCGSDGKDFDGIEKAAQQNEYEGTWTHWAFVKSVGLGEMSIYRNGILWHTATGKTKPLPKTAQVKVGRLAVEDRCYYHGAIADLRIWNRARTQEEIQSDFGKTLKGEQNGLVGYWTFANNAAKDSSASKRDATIVGTPKFETILGRSTGQIQIIGNQKTGGHQSGKLAEVRIWAMALKPEEIEINSKIFLSGNEPGLLGYYPLNEATGTEVRDATGSGRNGTIQGASWWNCTAVIGNLGHQVMQFDGKNDYVELAYRPELNPNQFTVSCWAKVSGGQGTYRSVITSRDENPVKGYIIYAGADNKWQFWIGNGGSWVRVSGSDIILNSWTHITATFDGSKLKLYINAELVGEVVGTYTVNAARPLRIGAGTTESTPQYFFCGKIAELHIWKKARSLEEIQAAMNEQLTGKEAELVCYLPLNQIKLEATTIKTTDVVSSNSGTVNEAIIVADNSLPIGSSALVSCEYSTVSIDPITRRKSALMRRFFAYPALNGVNLLPDKRIEQLNLKWIGNAQFAPTLLGYIEGAPPIPSENLTESDDYNGATSVEITISEDVEFSWNRSQESGLGATIDLFVGSDTEVLTGGGVGAIVLEKSGAIVGGQGNRDFNYQFINESNITSSSSQQMTDKLELRGTQETSAKFSHLGKRFIPKNVGYALVISSLADVFITKLARSGKMVGYQVQPVEGISPDVNTITFLLNPTYTMNGSLDGLTGSNATSDRFFRHVPEMRSQYGSLYPASYYRLQEAYDLKQQIEREDKRRESYFAQFNVRLIDETSLDREVGSGEVPVGISLQREEDKATTGTTTNADKEAAQQAQLDKFNQELENSAQKQSELAKKKKAEIQSKIDDLEKRKHATDSFAGWQKRMEDIQARSGKRNIVNTYVWDADGGLRAEAQSFASTAEHTIGGSFTLDAGLGFRGEFDIGPAATELTALATVNMTQTMTKTEVRSKGIELSVDLSGVESKGITDYNDYPIIPGEKVDRYRFMSFYLEGSNSNFYDFFNYVVDPEWLQSNDEEARALRQVMVGKPNKAWRVLHRVTYVERPALMGFGRDLRSLKQEEEIDAIKDLAKKQKALEEKLDQIMGLLKQKLP